MHTRVTYPPVDLERAAVARLLSIGLTCPDAGTVDELRSLSAVLADGAPEGHPLADLVEAMADDDAVRDLPYAYEELFGGQVVCPPYEASYEADPFRGTRQMSDAAGFYRAFGATPDGSASERPDHAACELEFLAFVIAKRIAAAEVGDTATEEVCAAAEDEFIRGHLSRFLGPLCEAITAAAETPVYRALGRVGHAFITAELGARGIDAPTARRPGPSVVEADEVSCGGAGGCPLTDLIGRPASNGSPSATP